MHRKIRIVVAILVILWTAGRPVHARQGTEKGLCGTKNIIVIVAEHDEDRRQTCRGALEAGRFLKRQGFMLPEFIRIEVVSAMPEGIAETAIGAYSIESKKIFVLSFQSFEERTRRQLGIAYGRPGYRAVVAHEVAHAVALYNFTANPTLVAQEYIGFVTLFSIMPKGMRYRTLQRYADYDPEWLSYPELLYFSNPVEFGVHAYRHFLLPENGRRFVRKVLDGAALGERE